MGALDDFRIVGLVGSRPLAEITDAEFNRAIGRLGWRAAHNAHVFSRLREHGPQFGINTLEDLARALRGGNDRPDPQPGCRRRYIAGGQAAYLVYREQERSFITFRYH